MFDFPNTFRCRDKNETCAKTMKSHISFKWSSLDIISSKGKVGLFRILSEKTKNKMGTEKQNYYVVNHFQANILFLHLLKTAETLLFFRFVLRKKGNIRLKWVDNLGKQIISIRNNATLIYGLNVQTSASFDKC